MTTVSLAAIKKATSLDAAGVVRRRLGQVLADNQQALLECFADVQDRSRQIVPVELDELPLHAGETGVLMPNQAVVMIDRPVAVEHH